MYVCVCVYMCAYIYVCWCNGSQILEYSCFVMFLRQKKESYNVNRGFCGIVVNDFIKIKNQPADQLIMKMILVADLVDTTTNKYWM